MNRKALNEPKESYSYVAWLDISCYTMVLIMSFCRRRPGELERSLLTEFKKYEAINEVLNKGIFGTLSAANQAVVKKYVRFLIRDKMARTVSVILSSSMLQSLQLIVK